MKAYDYVIVGAGSAGCVLANRLTEDPDTTVLLLEAGGPDARQEIHIPAAFPKLFKTQYDWSYHTDEQAQLNRRKLFWPRGKVLGGSSSINSMIYSRANRYNHDHWLDLGNEGWGFADALHYYKKAQNQERGASEYHGTGGPLNVADLRSVNPLSHAFVEARSEAGLQYNDDFNGAKQDGAGFFQVTQKNGKRHSAAAAYLKPALTRPNLTVTTQAQVMRLQFNGRRARGLLFIEDGKPDQVRANREVILSGGTVNSPQLLMLSGIGPADHLKSKGMWVRVDLPGVGENLQDHLMVGVCYECTKPVTLAAAEGMASIASYLLLKRGPLTSNVGEAGAFIRIRPDEPAPDLEIIFAPVYFMSHGFLNPAGHGFSLGLVLQRPESRGRIRLRSNDPLDPPAIQPEYLSCSSDQKILVEGVRLARLLAGAGSFAEFRGAEVWPGAQVKTDQAISGFIGETAETLYHPVGTCKMGSDEMAVVDERLRVRGVEGLRVVDASVLPSVITGHTHAPVVMIAEKAADMIKEGP